MPQQWRSISFWFVIILSAINVPTVGAQERVRLGLSSVSATSGSIWVAEEKGLFKKHGIDAEVIIIGGGAAQGVAVDEGTALVRLGGDQHPGAWP